MVCVRGVPGVTGTLGKANSHFDPIQTGLGPHHHVEAAVDWCSLILLALNQWFPTFFAARAPFSGQNILRTPKKFWWNFADIYC